MTTNDHDVQKIYLPDPSRLDILPDGETEYINRPLAREYVFPGRGNAPHQIDNNVKTVDFEPSEDDGPIDTLPKENPYRELIPPKPVPVQIVPEPARTILRESYTVPLWSVQTIPGGTYETFDIVNVLQLAPYDPTRTKIRLPVLASFSSNIGLYALAHTKDMSNPYYIYSTTFNPDIEFITQSQLFVGFIIQDVSQDTVIRLNASAWVDIARTIDSNP